MGQTQLLLVVLGLMLIGIAIYVGVSIFSANTVEDTRNAIIVDLQNFATRANAFYWKPVSQGGGGKSFEGITLSKIYPMAENVNAKYSIESTEDDQCVIVGVGKIVTTNGDSIRVRIRVTTERNIVEIVN
ncbi:MAG TPA: hypothetical protein DEP53_01085 [Bacteroidetes bacterium]|nr:MAG: hypothetical protein A2X66_04180 [Ignavibacteria bacterium GWA2_54_16]HCA78306.1 hypothetical protein [Bacteroidota bacterium]